MTARSATAPAFESFARAAGRAALLGCLLWLQACCHPGGEGNRAPVLQPLAEQAVDEGSPLEVLVAAADPDGDPVLLSAAPLPPNAAFTNHGDGTATLTFAPDFTQAGTYAVVVTATDGNLSASVTLLVTVRDVNRPPLAAPGGPYVGRAGDAMLFDGGGSADPDGDPLSFAWDFGDGARADGPTPTHAYAAPGSYAVTLTVADGRGGAHAAAAAAEVAPRNRAPTFDPLALRIGAEGEPLSFQVAASDPDGDPLAYEASGLPDGASFHPASRTLSWTPAFDQAGLYAVLFTARDPSGLVATLEVALSVADVNRPPGLLTEGLPDGRVDQEYSASVSASDPDGDPLHFTLTQGPQGLGLHPLTGRLSWRPTVAQIGTHAVGVQVDDGRGQAAARQYSLSVPDTIAPSVLLSAPRRAIPGASFLAVARAEDNAGVSSLVIGGEGLQPQSYQAPPYEREVALPSVLPVGVRVALRATATDPSGNRGEAVAAVDVVAAPDTTPPQIALNAPPRVTPGTSVLLSASLSDDAGVARVTFYADGVAIGTATGANPSVPYDVPADLSTPPVFSATAEDFSGNAATADAPPATVDGARDTTPPAASLAAPPAAELGSPLELTPQTSDDRNVVRVDVYVNHTLVASYPVPPAGAVQVPLPPGLEPGTEALVEVVATDSSGNQATASRVVGVEAPAAGLVAGEVYDDGTGLPLGGAEVTFVGPDGEPVAGETDARGRYSLAARAGTGRLLAARPGFTAAERIGLIVTKDAGREALDARLTALTQPSAPVSGVLGGTVSAPFSAVTAGLAPVLRGKGLDASEAGGTALLTIPAGALAADQPLAVTQVSPQGLRGLLPGGWSPVAAIDVSPSGTAFAAPATLTVPNSLWLVAGAKVALVRWDEGAHAWRTAGAAAVSADGLTLGASLTETGQYALVVPDVLPQVPPDPTPGELLAGVAPALVPARLAAAVSPAPTVLFYQPGVRSDVGVALTASNDPPPSGTPILARISEAYEFFSGDRVGIEPFGQDLVLYNFGRTAPTAAFPVTPSYAFAPLTLKQGVITVDALGPEQAGRSVPAVGPEGGTVALGTGEALTFPAGAVATLTAVAATPLPAADLGADVPPGFAYAGGVSVSFGGKLLGSPATLSAPAPGLPDGVRCLLAEVVEVQGATRFALAGLGEVQDGKVVSSYDLGGRPLEGIVSAGRYAFLRPLGGTGFAAGSVFGTDGAPLAGALVSAELSPLAALSRADGTYAAAVGIGPFAATALNLQTLDSGTAAGQVDTDGQIVPLDISLAAEPPRVVSTDPGDGATNVALSSAVRVQFSEAVDPATATPANLAVIGPGGPAAGTIALSSGGTLTTWRPSEPLQPNTEYAVTASREITDLAGNALAAAVTFRFTSLDTLPPPAPPAGSVAATIPGTDGKTTVTATQGTASPHDTVTLQNETQGLSAPAPVNPDGSFSAPVQAALIDKVKVVIRDPAGNETVVPLGALRNPDGSVAVGPDGGQLTASNGVIVTVPAGAFPNGAVVKLTALAESEIGVSPGADYPFVAGFQLESSEAPKVYLNASAPLPAGAGPDSRGIVARVAEAFGAPALAIVDTAKAVDGRLATSSPPCPGVKEKSARYGMYLNAAQSMALGQALLSILAPPVRSVVVQAYTVTAGVYSALYPFVARTEATDYVSSSRVESVCLPAPPDRPLKIVLRDPGNRQLLEELDAGPTPPDNTARITLVDRTDRTPPTVVGVRPIHRRLEPSQQTLRILFSEPVTPESAATVKLTARGNDARVFPGQASLDENNCRLWLVPDRPLPLGTTFELRLDAVRDLAGNAFEGAPLPFTTSSPQVVYPTATGRLDAAAVTGALGSSPPAPSFTDLDFVTRSPEESPTGRWQTDLVALHGDQESGHPFTLFTIDAADPTQPRLLGGFATESRYLQERLRLLDDVALAPRAGTSAVPAFWVERELHFRSDDPTVRLCVKPEAPELQEWRARHCPNPGDCEVRTGGCGDLAVTPAWGMGATGANFSYLWAYDVTDQATPRWISSRTLGYQGPLPLPATPSGVGRARGVSLSPDADVTHGSLTNTGTVAAYVASPGLGLELEDLGLNVPAISDADRAQGSPDLWARREQLGLNAHLYYQDVATLGGRVVAVAGAPVNTFEVFRPDLAGEPTGMVALGDTPRWLAPAPQFPSRPNAAGDAVTTDLAFVTGPSGVTAVELPADGTAPWLAGRIPTPSDVEAGQLAPDRVTGLGYAGATNLDKASGAGGLLVLDLSRTRAPAADEDDDGWDDRILGRALLEIPGYFGPRYLRGLRLDRERNLLYAGLKAGAQGAGGGLAVYRLGDCADLGVDFKEKPEPLPLPWQVEKMALQQVIEAGLDEAEAACGAASLAGVSMIEQGSGACLWAGNCTTNYQPGLSDHDYEVFFPRGAPNPDCVIAALARQVVDDAGDAKPVKLENGYEVTFSDISFFPMVKEEFEQAALNIDPPKTKLGDVTGDMGLGRQMLLLKWLLEGVYVDIPGRNLKGEDLGAILQKLRRPLLDPQTNEPAAPSHIPRLEGYEWAKLQWAELLSSGALIRLGGEASAGTTLHHLFEKELHKVGKAGIRSVLAKLVADETGNRLVAELATGSVHAPGTLACLDASASDDPAEWKDADCDSFEHFVASAAARSVKDEALPLFTPAEVHQSVYRFYRVKAGRAEGSLAVDTEEKANDFLSRAFLFVRGLGENGGAAHAAWQAGVNAEPLETAAKRTANLSSAVDRAAKAQAGGRQQIVPRVFNRGGRPAADVTVRLDAPGRMTTEKVTVLPGDEEHLDRKRVDGADGKPASAPVFALEGIDQSRGSLGGWVSFLVDVPDRRAEEPDRKNNWATVYYYVLDPEAPAAPAPADPALPVPDPAGDLLAGDPVCGTPPGALHIALTAAGASQARVFVNTCADVDVAVENRGEVPLTDIELSKFSLRDIETVDRIDALQPGALRTFRYEYCAGPVPGNNEALVAATYRVGGRLESVLSDRLPVVDACAVAVVPRAPDLNPEVSPVMTRGTFCRHYRAVDQATGAPLAGAVVRALLDNGFAPNVVDFPTDAAGDAVTGDKKGLCVAWKDWGQLPQAAGEQSPTLTASLTVPGTCAEPVTFRAQGRPFEFEESVKTRAAVSIGAVAAGADLGDWLNLSLLGLDAGMGETRDLLRVSAGDSYKGRIGLELKSPGNARDGTSEPERLMHVSGPSLEAGLSVTYSTGRDYDFPLQGLNLSQADKLKVATRMMKLVAGSGRPGMAEKALFAQASDLIEDLEGNLVGRSDSIALLAKASVKLLEASIGKKGAGGLLEAKVKAEVGAGAEIGSSLVWEEDLTDGLTRQSWEIQGKLEAKAGLEAGVEAAVSKGADPDEKALLEAEVAKLELLSAQAGVSGGARFALTCDPNRNWLPQRLDVSFSGDKTFGLPLVGDVIEGDGFQRRVTYSVTRLEDIRKAALAMPQVAALLPEERRRLWGIALAPELDATPLELFKSVVQVLALALDHGEYLVTKTAGSAEEHSFGPKILGVGIEESVTVDHAVSFAEEWGVFRGGRRYRLASYSGEGFIEPVPVNLEAFFDGILASLQAAENAFCKVERTPAEGGGGTVGESCSATLTLGSQADFDAVQGPLAFRFDGQAGPFPPYHYAPADLAGATDRPHYGIGRFHEYFPRGRALAGPATLVVDYADEEVAGLDEGTLALYVWNPDRGDWDHLGGALDKTANTVTAPITRLGTYTLAPAMPAGAVPWDTVVRTPAGDGTRLTLTSAPLLRNDGKPVADGAVFHVASAVPNAQAPEGLLPLGTVVTADALPDVPGSQVRVSGGRVQVTVELPAGAAAARIVCFSDVGTALGDEVVTVSP